MNALKMRNKPSNIDNTDLELLLNGVKCNRCKKIVATKDIVFTYEKTTRYCKKCCLGLNLLNFK